MGAAAPNSFCYISFPIRCTLPIFLLRLFFFDQVKLSLRSMQAEFTYAETFLLLGIR